MSSGFSFSSKNTNLEPGSSHFYAEDPDRDNTFHSASNRFEEEKEPSEPLPRDTSPRVAASQYIHNQNSFGYASGSGTDANHADARVTYKATQNAGYYTASSTLQGKTNLVGGTQTVGSTAYSTYLSTKNMDHAENVGSGLVKETNES